MKKSFFSLLLALIMVFCFSGCASTSTAVDKITVTKMPTKTVYNIGDEFSVEGGELTVEYEDGTEEVLSLTDDALEVSSVDTTRAGSKAVRIIYEMRRTQFVVEVKPFIVSFVLGDGMGEIAPIEIKKVGPISNMPEDPTVDGYEFGGWYTDAGFTNEFDVKSDIVGDTSLYAMWLDQSITYYNVRFDYNYGIGSPYARRQQVAEGESATRPADPVRRGYSFDGWFTAAEGGEEYDFATPVTADIRVYAHWTLTATTAEEYVFEAEDLDLDDLSGVGYSSNTNGPGMIMQVDDPSYGLSNERAVGYLYKNGIRLDFRFVANKEASDAKIVVRLGAEFADHHITPDMFEIALNGTPIDYGQIDITDVPNQALGAFKDFEIAVDATLLEGENIITMTVTNNTPLIGGATSATAPIVDCVKVTTSSVLWWNGDYDLPKENY